jgi:hypothetical protein
MAKSSLTKLIKYKYDFSPVLHNRVVLYFFLFIAVVEIVYFIGSKDVVSLVTFLIIGFLTTFFNKNMIIVLFLSLVVTNILKYGTGSPFKLVNEGFEDKESESKKKDEHEEKIPKKDEIKENKEVTDNKESTSEKVTAEKVDEQYENLKEEYPKFKVVQQEILNGVQKMAPLLEKAEKFIDKFDAYKNGKMKESFSKHKQ